MSMFIQLNSILCITHMNVHMFMHHYTYSIIGLCTLCYLKIYVFDRLIESKILKNQRILLTIEIVNVHPQI